MRQDRNPTDTDDLPIYRQLADKLREAIRVGELSGGDKLPSIRELAKTEDVSVGTVRRVYQMLEMERLIETRPGRGSYVAVRMRDIDHESRKDKALEAIDAMLDDLSAMGFTTREAEIFFQLRLRQKEDMTRPIQVAVVAATPEERSIIGEAIETIPFAKSFRVFYDDVLAEPKRIGADFDFVIAPLALARELRSLIADDIAVLPVVITVQREMMFQCQRVPAGARVGVLTVSQGFQDIMRRECTASLSGVQSIEYELFGNPERTRAFIERQDVIIVAPDYTNLVDAAEAHLVRDFGGDHAVIRSAFRCDRGSLLYIRIAIEDRYKELRQSLRA